MRISLGATSSQQPLNVNHDVMKASTPVAVFGDTISAENKPGFISRAFWGIVSIPKMIVCGFFSLIRRVINICTLGCFCKPKVDMVKFKEALVECQKAGYSKESQERLKKLYPQGNKIAADVMVDHKRKMEAPKGANVQHFNQNVAPKTAKDTENRWEKGDRSLLDSMIKHLPQE